MPIAYDRMPTVAEVRAELKSNGIKGYSGKRKAELYEMIKMLPIASSRRLLGPRTPAAPAVIADAMRKYEEAKERAKAAFERLSEKKKIPSGALAGGPELEHLERHVRHRVKKVVEIPESLIEKIEKDPFIVKAGIHNLIGKLRDIVAGKGDEIKGESRNYGVPVYDLGTFHSMRWPKNANNVLVPKKTNELISQIPGLDGLMIYDTGDTEAYGRYNDVIMVALGKQKVKEVVKERTPRDAGTIEEYLERLIKLYLIEEDLATDDTVDKVLQKIEDRGDYHEYQEEAIKSFGGHEAVASNIYNYLIKHGRSRSYILNAMREAKKEGFTMFDDIIKSRRK